MILGGEAGLAATDHWTGRSRDDFAEESPALFSELGRLRTDLLALARRIERAATEATAEQSRRDDQRERWRDERDGGDAADAFRGSGGWRDGLDAAPPYDIDVGVDIPDRASGPRRRRRGHGAGGW